MTQVSGLVLMVTRNNLHLTKKAVASVLSQTKRCSLLVVDNASTDGTAEWLRGKPLATILYTQPRPLAHCWNHGLKTLWKVTDHPRVLVINNDVELHSATVATLDFVSQSLGAPFVTGVSVSDRSQLVIPEDWSTRPHPDFSCFMLHREVFRRVGPFDERFSPAFYEDNDYHVRMHRAGIRAICCGMPFLHHGSMTIKNSSPQDKAKIQRGAEKGKELFRSIYGCYPGSKEYEALFNDVSTYVTWGSDSQGGGVRQATDDPNSTPQSGGLEA